MGFFSLFRKTVTTEEFSQERQKLWQELEVLKSAISNEQQHVDKNFGIIENRLNVLQNSQDNLTNMLTDLKLVGKLTLDNKSDIQSILERLETIENQFSQPVVNFTKPSQQGLVNVSKRLVNVDQRFTTGLLENNAPADSDFSGQVQVDHRFTRGLLSYTNTEKTLLLALYDMQADSEVGAVGVKEAMEKIYGANAAHSKLVYVSKMIKDLESKGALIRIVRGNHSKVFLTELAIKVCEETIRARK